MGRRTKLTAEIRQKIVTAIQAGATYDLCAQFAGISPSTLYRWMQQGREGKDRRKKEFLEAIKRAESHGAIQNLGLIQKAANDGDWKASAWILERRHGYNRGSDVHKEPAIQSDENAIDISTISLLRDQLAQTMKASKTAMERGSFQAFASLQRQVVQIALQIDTLESQGMGDEFATQSDEDILSMISNLIVGLPPILQQRLQSDILGLKSYEKSATISDA